MFVDRDLTMKYTKKIVSAIFGNMSFDNFPPPNRRLDMFLKSKHLKPIYENAEDKIAFENAFNFLKHNGLMKVVIVEDKSVMSSYFDGIDIFCSYAKKVYTKCFVSLTEKGIESWYKFRETGKWDHDCK